MVPKILQTMLVRSRPRESAKPSRSESSGFVVTKPVNNYDFTIEEGGGGNCEAVEDPEEISSPCFFLLRLKIKWH